MPGGLLAPDAALDLQLLSGVEPGGTFRCFVNTEAGVAPVVTPAGGQGEKRLPAKESDDARTVKAQLMKPLA